MTWADDSELCAYHGVDLVDHVGVHTVTNLHRVRHTDLHVELVFLFFIFVYLNVQQPISKQNNHESALNVRPIKQHV